MRRTPLEEGALFNGRTAVSQEETQFNQFQLEETLLRGIAESGYAELTSLQEKMVPPLLERESLIVQASRGAGKTAGYLIPLLHTMSGRMGPRLIILTPTRDLAIQVFNEVRRLMHFMDRRATLIDPGSSINQQTRELEDDPEILIGTPGRLLDHIRRGTLKIEEPDCVVLDEVDRMLDHGQRPDVEAILKKIYGCDHTIAISTTISPPVLRLCRKAVEGGQELFTAPEKPTVEAVRHSFFKTAPEQKIDLLYHLIEREQPERAIIFCRTKVGAARVMDRIKTLQGGAMELHMGMTGRRQEQIVKRFREKKCNVLVTTDTFTHDLDVENISHVINFDVPEDPEDYLFRIGKTARLGEKGRAMTLVTDEDLELLDNLKSAAGGQIEEEMLAGFEPEAPRPRSEPPPHSRKSEPETPGKQPKSEYFHGGWYKKLTGRRRR